MFMRKSGSWLYAAVVVGALMVVTRAQGDALDAHIDDMRFTNAPRPEVIDALAKVIRWGLRTGWMGMSFGWA